MLSNELATKKKSSKSVKLQHELKTEIDRLSKFNYNVGAELDGQLRERDERIEEAVRVTLDHTNHVLSRFLADIPAFSAHVDIDTFIDKALPQILRQEILPMERKAELDKLHPIKDEDAESAVREFRELNDGLEKLAQSIRFAGALPAYQSKPSTGELLVESNHPVVV